MARETVASVRAELGRHLALAEDALKVWQQRAIRAEKQVDELTKVVVKLSTPAAPVKHKPRQGTPDVEGVAMERHDGHQRQKAYLETLERGTKHIMSKNPGISEAKARAEAREILDRHMEAEGAG